ncbi:TetR/AcrR family transcriptional regulator [Pseudoclavibacter terrae]|uniref:TetR/AcrR family transcriptional regulator n=1 Tax=Pseudoclavibacter terrae TaxID=1530195 RepID=UPI00232B84E8|nr:TetR/AcrR family transcriptional regulator [Pseudoclavibacter terrae]
MDRAAQREQGEQTRRALVQAAAVEFAAHGYTAAVLEHVSDRLGLTKGAVYFHFPTKAELARAVGETWTAMWAEEVARSTERGFDLQELESFMVRMTERAQHDDVWAATIRLAHDREHIPDEIPRPSEAWLTVIGVTLQASETRGELRQGVDLEAIAWQLTAHVIGMHSVMSALDDKQSPADRVRQLLDSYRSVLATTPTRR